MFKKQTYLSEDFNQLLLEFLNRVDTTERDRDFLYDLISFAYEEGKGLKEKQKDNE